MHYVCVVLHIFFFNNTAPTEIYTLSLHDALPISVSPCTSRRRSLQYTPPQRVARYPDSSGALPRGVRIPGDRKSTRLNSSHSQISYAVFCLKKKKTHNISSKIHISNYSHAPMRIT